MILFSLLIIRDLVPLSAFLSVIGFVTRFSAFCSPGVIGFWSHGLSDSMWDGCGLLSLPYYMYWRYIQNRSKYTWRFNSVPLLLVWTPFNILLLGLSPPPPPQEKNQPVNRRVQFKNGVAQCTSAVANISSCQVNAISRRGIVQRGCSFGFIFLLFLLQEASAHAHSSRGKSPAPGS